MVRVLVLYEGGVERVVHHIHKGEYAILSAHRGEHSAKQNREAVERMAKHLRSLGYGFKRVIGRGQEIDPKTGKIKVSLEKSFFVPGMKRHHAHHVAKRFKQDYYIHGKHGKSHLIHTKTGEVHATWHRTKKAPAKYDTMVRKKGGHRRGKKGSHRRYLHFETLRESMRVRDLDQQRLSRLIKQLLLALRRFNRRRPLLSKRVAR